MCLIFIEHTLWFSAFVVHHIIVFLEHKLPTFGLLSQHMSLVGGKNVEDTKVEHSK